MAATLVPVIPYSPGRGNIRVLKELAQVDRFQLGDIEDI